MARSAIWLDPGIGFGKTVAHNLELLARLGELTALGRPLVIKVLLAHLARDGEMRERFRREAESSAQLFHPHICSILDFGEVEQTVYLVMPYLAGGSLASNSNTDKISARFAGSSRKYCRSPPPAVKCVTPFVSTATVPFSERPK